MKDEDQSLAVLLDEGVPVAVAAPFLSRRHRVIYHSDVLESGADDRVVAAAAILNRAALIAVDLDMKRLVRRFGMGTPEKGVFVDPRFMRLSAANSPSIAG